VADTEEAKEEAKEVDSVVEVEMAAAVAEVGGPSHLQQLSLHRGHP